MILLHFLLKRRHFSLQSYTVAFSIKKILESVVIFFQFIVWQSVNIFNLILDIGICLCVIVLLDFS